MRKAATHIILLLVTLLPARGVVEPTSTLKQLAQFSEIIVLCDEINFRHDVIPPQSRRWNGKETIAECKIIRIFKGDLEPDGTFLVIYGSSFLRQLDGHWRTAPPFGNIDKKDPRVYSGESFPPGRALLFLRKDKTSGELMVITAKLIYKNKAFDFDRNRYELTRQAPENIRLANPHKYGEDQLIEDLLIAMGKSPHPIYTPAPAPLNPVGANIIRSMHAWIITTTGVITLLLLVVIGRLSAILVSQR